MKVRALFFAAAMFAMAGLHAAPAASSIDVPDGNRSLRVAKGKGVQIYMCSQAQNGPKWTLQGPDAKLLDAKGKVIGAHFAGPTWKLKDGGVVKGEKVNGIPSPQGNSVDWLLLRAVPGTAEGSLSKVTFIQRTDTTGGLAPNAGCRTARNIGKKFRSQYTATYTFYVAK